MFTTPYSTTLYAIALLAFATMLTLGISQTALADHRADGDRDGFISVAEGVPFYGSIAQSLTTDGDTSPSSALALDRYPVADDDG